MSLSLEQLQQLRQQLPELDFSLQTDQSTWLQSQLVQNYLNHYRINFSDEGLCQAHHFGRYKASSFEVAAHIFETKNSRGTVFFIHGFTDSVGIMHHPIRYLLQQRWNVVALDLPGHGLSSGTQASIDSFDQYRDVLMVCLKRCQSALPRPWHGVGQSTGAAVWLNYLGSLPQQKEIENIALVAPLIRPKGWALAQWFFPLYKLFIKGPARNFTENSHDENFLNFIKHQDPLQTRITPTRWVNAMNEWIGVFDSFPVQARPLLIIQGDDDHTVDFEHNLPTIKEKFPNTRVKMIKEARHQLVNESETYRQPMLDAIGQWLDD
ncbi:MAG: alpha/beta hydrolase [Cellvibrionaceae bacterium]